MRPFRALLHKSGQGVSEARGVPRGQHVAPWGKGFGGRVRFVWLMEEQGWEEDHLGAKKCEELSGGGWLQQERCLWPLDAVEGTQSPSQELGLGEQQDSVPM